MEGFGFPSPDGSVTPAGTAPTSFILTHSNLSTLRAEVYISPHYNIAAVKRRLATHCGTAPANQHLTLLHLDGSVAAELDDDDAKLDDYNPLNGMTIHVTDTDASSLSANGGLEDTSLVEKMTLSDEKAEERKDAFKKFREQQKQQAEISDDYMADAASTLSAEMACAVGADAKRGVVKFVGKIPEIAPGWWVGVQYDEAIGKNDGSVKGARYFECPENMGGFVRPDKVIPAGSLS